MDLTHYLWKAYKSATDEEFTMCIKDMKSQVDDVCATYAAEELFTMAENRYEAWFLDEETEWSKPTEEQEQIVVMNAEINLLNAIETLNPPSLKDRTTPKTTSPPQRNPSLKMVKPR